MTNQRHRQTYPPALRAEAFDLYLIHQTRSQAHAELRQRYGSDAPSLATLKRWAAQDNWNQRSRLILSHLQNKADHDRAITGAPFLDTLQQVRSQVLRAIDETPFHSAEGALYALAALERIIDRERRHQQMETINRSFREEWELDDQPPALDDLPEPGGTGGGRLMLPSDPMSQK